MIPIKDPSSPFAVEYHHMDQLEFEYYHVDQNCAFKNVLCKSNQCVMNMMRAFYSHIKVSYLSAALISSTSALLTKLADWFGLYNCNCIHFSNTQQNNTALLAVPQKTYETICGHTKLISKHLLFEMLNHYDCDVVPENLKVMVKANVSVLGGSCESLGERFAKFRETNVIDCKPVDYINFLL